MPRIDGTTNRQSEFLRALVNNPAGIAPADWPGAPLLRRWLRRPGFRRALRSLRATFRFQADLALTAAAAGAATAILPTPEPPPALIFDKDTFVHLRAIVSLANRRNRPQRSTAKTATAKKQNEPNPSP